MSVAVVTSGLDVMGRLFEVCNGKIASVLSTEPSPDNPIGDLQGTGKILETPTYRYSTRSRVPYAVNANVVGFLYRRGHTPGQRATGDGEVFHEVERRLQLGIYIRILPTPVEPKSWPIINGREMEWWEFDWYRAEAYAAAHEHLIHAFLADGATILDVIDVTLVDLDVAAASARVKEHIFARLEFEAHIDTLLPVNRFQF